MVDKNIIQVLIDFELKAAELYERAATVFVDDRGLAFLLTTLAEEEHEHADILKVALATASKRSDASDVTIFDPEDRERLTSDFSALSAEMDAGTLTKEALIGFVVSIEYSEFNEIFLYVVNSVKEESRDVIPKVVKIQQHKKHVERFIDSRPEFVEYQDKMERLPNTWDEHILVIDDKNNITSLLEAIFFSEGSVERAENYEDALEKLKETYYAAIISDVNMPIAGGIGFYEKAAEIHPEVSERILFLAGPLKHVHKTFLEDNKLSYISKPISIKDIKKAVLEILYRK